MVILAVIALVVLFALGAPIFAVMLAGGAFGATVTSRGDFLQDFGAQIADIAKIGTGEPATIFSTIPLFIFIGFLMAESKTADRMVRFAQAALGWLPGGLAVVTIFACAIFTTFTGASGVTIVALGGLIMPSLIKEGYPERFSLGLVAGTGSVGLLFPPALPLFVYGTIYGIAAQTQGDTGEGAMKLIDFSSESFLFAGIVPGLVLIGIMSIFAIGVAIYRGVPRKRFDVGELAKSFFVAIPELALPVLIIGGLVSGITIPEIAALATVYTLLVEMVLYRDVKPRQLWALTREAMTLVGAIFIIIFAASALTNFFITAEVHNLIFRWLTETFESKWTFLLALNVFLLLVGMTMDIFSAIVVIVPLIYLPAQQFGIDPYHLGIIFLLNLEIGYLTPPVGLNLFITGFTFRKPIPEVIRATIPFALCMVIALALVVFVEALTIVPEPERRGRVSQLTNDVAQAFKRVNAVQEVTLPDGTVMKLESCDALAGLEQASCRGLFLDVTKCSDKPAAEVEPCKTEVIESYVELNAAEEESDDWDSWDEEADTAEDGALDDAEDEALDDTEDEALDDTEDGALDDTAAEDEALDGDTVDDGLEGDAPPSE